MKTHTKRTQETRTKRTRGIRVAFAKDGRKCPWQLFVHRKFREAFEKESQAQAAAREVVMAEIEHGKELRDFDAREWRRYCDAKAAYWQGSEPDWVSLGQLSARRAPKPLNEAVRDYLAARIGLAPDTLRQTKRKLAVLEEAFTRRPMGEITSAELRTWLAGLTSRGYVPVTTRHYLKVARRLWSFAIREKWVTENPALAVELPRVILDEVGVITPEQTVALFEANKGKPGIGRLCLEAFGGLRTSSAARLSYSEIDFENKGILLPAAKHKSGRRQFVDGLPANLWTWLASIPKEDFDADPLAYRDQKHDAFVRAKVTPTHNCLRHSFCTYHVAAYRDAARTAVCLQHANPSMLYRHYKGRATEAQGLAYFAIV